MCLEYCTCCGPCAKFHDFVRDKRERDKQHAPEESDPAAILILENALQSTVDLIVENSSWATAGILSIACSLSISYTNWASTWESWIYFSILLLFALIYGTYPQTLLVDDYETIGKNLEMQMTKRIKNRSKNSKNLDKGKGGGFTTMTIAEYLELQEEEVITADREKIAKRLSGTNNNKDDAIPLTTNTNNNNNNNDNNNNDNKINEALLDDIDENSESKNDDSTNDNNNKVESKSQIRKLARLTHIEVNILFKNMNSLAIATFANVIALTFNSAVTQTVEDYVTDDNLVVLTYWLVALFETVVTLGSTFFLAKSLVKNEIETFRYIRKNGIANSKSQLIKFRSHRRLIKLICYIFGVAMAWGWRNAIKYSIIAMFVNEAIDGTVIVLIIYVVIVQVLVTLFNTLSRGMRALNKSHFGKYFNFDEIKQRNYKNKGWLLYAVWYKNLQVVVGLSWYDLIVGASSEIAGGTSSDAYIICLWLGVLILIFISVTFQFYWKKYWFGFEILRKGLLRAYYDNSEDAHDSSGEMDDETDTGDDSDIDNEMDGIVTQGSSKKTKGYDYGSFNNKSKKEIDRPEAATETAAMLAIQSPNTDVDEQIEKLKEDTGNDGPVLVISKAEAFWFLFWKEFVDLLIYAWSVGGSYSVYIALTYTFIALFISDYDYSSSSTDDSTDYTVSVTVLASIWIAWLISLFIAVLILTYLSTLVKAATDKRKQLFREWRASRPSIVKSSEYTKQQAKENARLINPPTDRP